MSTDSASVHRRSLRSSSITSPPPSQLSSSTGFSSPTARDSHDEPRHRTSSGGRPSFNSERAPPEQAKVAQMNSGQRARYIKTGTLLLFVFLLIYYISPTASGGTSIPGVGVFSNGDVATHSAGATTSRCTKSHSPDKPLVQYALMIDAGSTGSRIHVYRFNNCGPTPELEDEIFKMTPKKESGSGLSSYAADAEAAAKSLDMLMDVAVQNVPNSLKSCTPVAVKATAGLRKLGTETSDQILAAVRRRLENAYPFPVVSEEQGGVQVMDGKDEGVYAWITANYLLGKIGGPDQTPTAAVFDLGGGSTQIVFQPTFPHSEDGGMPDHMEEGDFKYELSFGGRDFTLYQHSYLGYGLMEARNNLHRLVVENIHAGSPDDRSWLSEGITNPCLAPDTSREVEVTLGEGHDLGEKVTVTMVGPSEGAAEQCRSLAEQTLHKDAECTVTPCAFNGVHQPSLSQTFAQEDVYLFSYFYDRTMPLGMPESFTLNELKDVTDRVCRGADAWDSFQSTAGAIDELKGRPEHCLDLNFMLALLHTGYEMPIDREVKIAKKIKGNELGWCLGASLPLLSQNSGWQCKVERSA